MILILNQLFKKSLLSGTPAKGLAVLIFLFCSGELSSQPWKFVKEEEGIKVYTAEEGNSSLKTFMGISDLHASVEKVSALLGDARGMSGWDKSVKEFRVLSEQKNKSFCYYLVYSTPWPLHDRDLCVEVNITREPSNGSVIILAKSNPKLVPENSSFVRIRNYWQKWIIEPLDIDHIRLTFEGYADPSGSVPSWLYNMVITETPIKMIREIRKRVE